jgi:hypothetical protein
LRSLKFHRHNRGYAPQAPPYAYAQQYTGYQAQAYQQPIYDNGYANQGHTRGSDGIFVNRDSRSDFLVNLPEGDLRLNEQTGVIPDHINLRAGMKPAITSCRFVVAFGIRESVLLPRQQRKSRAYSIQEKL